MREYSTRSGISLYWTRDTSSPPSSSRSALARDCACPFVDNELLYGRAEPGRPVIVDYFYHEEVRGTGNTGVRNK